MTAAKQTPKSNRERGLRRRYGIGEKEYNAMLEKQCGKCGICGHYRQLIVDHSHTSGKVRGLLCNSCNSGIGFFKESVTALEHAISYIKQHTGVE